MNAMPQRKPEQKRVTISSKRQFTIPQKFYSDLGFDREAECIMWDGMLILRPASQGSGGEFAEYILADLISEGYSGNELLHEFRKRQSQIRPAVESMLEAAREAAKGNGKHYSYGDLFDEEE